MIQLTRMPGGTCTGVAVAQITAVPQDVQIHSDPQQALQQIIEAAGKSDSTADTTALTAVLTQVTALREDGME